MDIEKKKKEKEHSSLKVDEEGNQHKEENNNHSIYDEVQEQNESHLNEENEKQCNLNNDAEIVYFYRNQEEQHSILNNHPEILHNITSTLNNDQKDQNPCPNIIYQKKQHKGLLNDIQNDLLDIYSEMERVLNLITPSNIMETAQLLIFDLRTRNDAVHIVKLLFKKVKNDENYNKEYIEMCKILYKQVVRERHYNSENKMIMKTFEEIMTKYCEDLLDTELRIQSLLNNVTSIISKETYTFIGELYNNDLINSQIVCNFVNSMLSCRLSENILFNICHLLKIIEENLEKSENANEIMEKLKKHISYQTCEPMESNIRKIQWDQIIMTQTILTKPSVLLPLEKERMNEEKDCINQEEEYKNEENENLYEEKEHINEEKEYKNDDNENENINVNNFDVTQSLLKREDNIVNVNESQSLLTDNIQTNGNDNNGNVGDENRSMLNEIRDDGKYSEKSFNRFNTQDGQGGNEHKIERNVDDKNCNQNQIRLL